jgi:hypothetical protein
MIATLRQATTRATVPTLRKRLGDWSPANAGLTLTARVNLDELASGTFSLVRKFAQEGSPSSIVNGLRQHAAGESFDIQIFGNDDAVAVNQRSRDFVVKVGSLVLNLRVLSLQQHNCFPAPIRPLVFTTSYGALGHTKLALSVTVQTRIVNFSAVAKGSEGCQTHINPDCCGRRRHRDFVSFNGEDGKPTSSLTLDRDSLDLPVNRTEFDLDLPHALDASHSAVKPASIPIGRKAKTVVSAAGFEAGESRLFATLNATKERLERLIEASEKVLTAGKVGNSNQALDPHLFQLACLIVIVDRLPANPVCPDTFFKSAVAEVARFAKLIRQRRSLLPVRVDPVLEGLDIQYTPKPKQTLRKACDSSAA